jgi:hypothetical protein
MAASGVINFGNRNRHVMRVPHLRYLIDGAIANRGEHRRPSAVSEPPMIAHGQGPGHGPDHGRPRRNIAPVIALVIVPVMAPAVAAKGRLASSAGPL